MSTRTFGAQSMTAQLRDVLVKRPAAAFGAAFDDPAHGYLHRVDLDAAQREHDALTAILADLGATVHELDAEYDPDLTYTFDPALVTDRGVLPLLAGKPNRVGEELVIERWCNEHGIPTAGPDRVARHGRGRRHVLAGRAHPVRGPDASHQPRRRRPAARHP